MATPTFFAGILGVLIAITLVLFVIAQNIVEPDLKLDDARVAEEVFERIEPIGRLNTSDIPVQASLLPVSNASTAAPFASGEEIYNAVCQACHSTGVLNSPVMGSRESWGERLNKSREDLAASVSNGLNLMPPKGGRPDLSDEQIRMTVDYMLSNLSP